MLCLSDSYVEKSGDAHDTHSDTYLYLKVLVINLNGCYHEGICKGECTARITDIMKLLSEHSTMPENIHTQISSENSIDKLKSWLKLVARTDSIESFESRM